MKDPDILSAVIPVIEAFETLGIRYYIGGSVASSAYGVPRTTLDVDLVADMTSRHVPSLVEMLEPFYYVDRTAISRAIDRVSSFNAIHLLENRITLSPELSPPFPPDRQFSRIRRARELPRISGSSE